MKKDLREVEFQLAMVRQELEEQKKLVESLKKQIKNWAELQVFRDSRKHGSLSNMIHSNLIIYHSSGWFIIVSSNWRLFGWNQKVFYDDCLECGCIFGIPEVEFDLKNKMVFSKHLIF